MNTLSRKEWELVFALPADGKVYNVEGVAFRAVHYPQTKFKMEQVMAETRFGTLRRRFSGEKWLATEYIEHAF